jgi:hypothetical protein
MELLFRVVNQALSHDHPGVGGFHGILRRWPLGVYALRLLFRSCLYSTISFFIPHECLSRGLALFSFILIPILLSESLTGLTSASTRLQHMLETVLSDRTIGSALWVSN